MSRGRVALALVFAASQSTAAIAGSGSTNRPDDPSSQFLARYDRLRARIVASSPQTSANPAPFGIELVEVTEAGVSVTTAVAGNLLLVNYASALVAYDISSPGVPIRLSYLPVPEGFYDIEMVGSHAFLAGEDGLVTIVDVSNPSQPAIVSSTRFGPAGNDLEVAGNLLFFACGWEPSWVIDITSLAAPVALGTFDPSGTGAVDVAYENQHLFVAMYGYGLRVYNVSNPSAPSLVASVPFAVYGIQQIDVSNEIAYAINEATMIVIDVSQPSSPQTTGALNLDGNQPQPPGTCWDIEVAGDYAYVTHFYNTESDFNVIDVANPTDPVLVATIPQSSGFDVAVSGNRAAVSSYDRFTFIHDVSEPTTPTPYGTCESLGSSDGMEAAGDWLGFPLHHNGLMLVHPDDPNVRHRLEGTQWEIGYAPFLASDGAYALISGLDDTWDPDQSGISIIDMRDPANMVETSFVPTSYYGDIAINGSFAYFRDDGIEVLDWSIPAAPQIVGSIMVGGARAIETTPTRAIVGGYTTFSILDVSTPQNPLLASQTEFGWEVSDVAITDGYAFVAGRRLNEPTITNGVWTYDISNPTAPIELTSFTLAAVPWSIRYSAQHVYLNAEDGLHIIDVSDPASPAEVGFADCGPLEDDVVVDPPFVYALSNGLMKFRVDALATGVRSEPAMGLRLDPCSPNPFNPTTSIRWFVDSTRQVSVEIYNVRGTLIRTLASRIMTAGQHSATWDGRDDQGRGVASGVYFCRLSNGVRSVTQKLTLLK